MGNELKQKLKILQHSMGLDQYGNGSKYRNRFVAGKGHSDFDCILSMVSDGLMSESRVSGSSLCGGDSCFHVTPLGERFISENSPKPPKVSRSKARYKRWLEFGGDCSFGEWIKFEHNETCKMKDDYLAV